MRNGRGLGLGADYREALRPVWGLVLHCQRVPAVRARNTRNALRAVGAEGVVPLQLAVRAVLQHEGMRLSVTMDGGPD